MSRSHLDCSLIVIPTKRIGKTSLCNWPGASKSESLACLVFNARFGQQLIELSGAPIGVDLPVPGARVESDDAAPERIQFAYEAISLVALLMRYPHGGK